MSGHSYLTKAVDLGSKQRAEFISSCLTDQRPGGHFVLYRGEYHELPVIKLSIDLLLYRADNGRLILQIQELQNRQGLPSNYFSDHQESLVIQEQLHNLLLEMAKDPSGPIYQELSLQAQQTEPLLITSQGLVVNGNRRLAAMRALLAEDPDKYTSFQEVRTAILPSDAQLKDIEYVEAALQLAPETKLAYSWINRRLKLRRQKEELNLPVPQIIKTYRLEDVQQLNRELQELELAETYLRDFLSRPGDYHLILDADQLFIGMFTNLSHLSKNDQQLWSLIGFNLIYVRQDLELDLNNYFPFTDPRPAYAPVQALKRLAVEEGLITERQIQQETDLPLMARQELEYILSSPQNANRIAKSILDILDQLYSEHREQNAPKRMLKHLRQARYLIESLDPDDLSNRQKSQASSELAALQHHGWRTLGPMTSPPPLVGGLAELAKGLNPEKPSFKAGLAHALRALLGRSLCRRLGGIFDRKD